MTAAATAPVATAGSDRTFPSSETDLMAPIGAAIARLVSRGQDHLSITVRFEQGGTLSLKLAMRDGEIASRIQTDVPGLEGALRSAWGQFAHDWQGRGLKLANPSFDAGVADHQPGDKGTRNPASDRDGPYSESGRTASSSFTPSPVSVRGAPVRRPSGNPSTADSGVTPGLKTWA